MATLTLKQVPDELLEQLRSRAQAERRSINQQALRLLEQGLAVPRKSFTQAIHEWRERNSPIDPGVAKALRGLRQKDKGRRVRL